MTFFLRKVLQDEAEKVILPRHAQAKLDAMQDKSAAGFQAMRLFHEKYREEIRIRDAIERELSDLISDHGGNGRVSSKLIEDANKALATQNAKIAAIDARQKTARAAVGTVAQPAQAIGDWLNQHKRSTFSSHTGTVKLRRRGSESFVEAVDNVRLEIAGLRADRHQVASAPIPATEAKANARQQIEALAETGAPDIHGCIEGGVINWPKSTLTNGAGQAIGYGVVDAMALSVWLMKDALIKRVEAEIDASIDPSKALSKADRRREDARILAAVLVAEREEEALIEAAAAAGTVIQRRANADPRAVLGLADNLPAPDEEI